MVNMCSLSFNWPMGILREILSMAQCIHLGAYLEKSRNTSGETNGRDLWDAGGKLDEA